MIENAKGGVSLEELTTEVYPNLGIERARRIIAYAHAHAHGLRVSAGFSLTESVPIALRRLLTGHDARSVIYMGWSALKNGDLIAQAEAESFEILITADQNIRYQQNMTRRRLSVIVLDTNDWPTIRENYQRILEAVEACAAGGFIEVAIRRSAFPIT